MSLTSEERQRLFQLFQACDTDSDGLVNTEDIRLLSSRSELSDYNPEELIDLFTSLNNEDSNLTFEDFVQRKISALERSSLMSETASMSSGFTNSSTQESLNSPYRKRYYRRRNNFHQNYDANLNNKYKTNLILDDIDCSLSKSMDNLQLETNPSSYHANLNAARRVFTAVPTMKNGYNYRENRITDLKRFKDYLQIDRFDLSDDVKKKFELIREDYFNCLNELSEENENICEELDRIIKERNYLRERIEILSEEYGNNLRKHREQWLCERQKFEQKIKTLEAYISKLSYCSSAKPGEIIHHSSWYNHHGTIMNNPDIINDNNPNKYNSTPDHYQDNVYSENLKLHQLANKISELALLLSEIISSLRKSELDVLMANCQAEQISKNVNLRDDEEEDIIQRYERAMLNRSLVEREAIDFIRNVDEEILVQYLSPAEFQKIFKTNGNRQLVYDLEFQNILHDLLAKLKDDLRNVNKTLDQHQQQIENTTNNMKFTTIEPTYPNYMRNIEYKL